MMTLVPCLLKNYQNLFMQLLILTDGRTLVWCLYSYTAAFLIFSLSWADDHFDTSDRLVLYFSASSSWFAPFSYSSITFDFLMAECFSRRSFPRLPLTLTLTTSSSAEILGSLGSDLGSARTTSNLSEVLRRIQHFVESVHGHSLFRLKSVVADVAYMNFLFDNVH